MSAPQQTQHLVDHLFRREAGRIVSMLTRVFGVDRIDLAEDVVQEALLKALQQWPYCGIPERPSAWIMQVAKHQALDVLRREQNLKSKEGEIVREALDQDVDDMDLFLEDEIEDDQLRMMFACCHPSLTPESQIALTLKTLCGFGTAEIARAFLSNEQTIHKRLVRAKQKLREERTEFEIPSGDELTNRLDTVVQALYLLFNEGYNASQGEELIRKDLCEEAIRLTRLLAQHSAGNTPKSHALLSLMLLHSARFPARVGDRGNLLLLKDQNRSLWDKNMIADGLQELGLSADGEKITELHLESGIAACHCLAENYDATDWSRILMLYDMLVAINDSPVVSLNRAIAISKVHGPQAGIQAVEEIKDRRHLDKYYLLYAVLGEFHMALGSFEEAAKSYRRALELTQVRSEQLFLTSKLEVVGQNLN
jgi:RNA polymerase sigma-70 factor (ECF subfamily)